jgi:hypothetical protein
MSVVHSVERELNVMTQFIRTRGYLLLGVIRLVNGAAALLAPASSARRLGVDPAANPAPIYPLRMFGIRTIVLGLELLLGNSDTRRKSLRVGVAIHASDTLSAATAGIRGQLPPTTAVTLTCVSTLNTTLAVLGTREHQ